MSKQHPPWQEQEMQRMQYLKERYQRDQIEELRRREQMAIAPKTRNGGIESWHREGFEVRVLTEVRAEISSMQKSHKNSMNELRSEVRDAKHKVEHINGFYTWLIETYPETVAQYKALMDLQKVGSE